ncbi:uncharacterized protein FIBRA_04261 [Fibroporia radiculosa]|uniref:Ubiquitin-like protease family profile domain-containing protein n=1 Tax=Fibroporia radiculosa TaxID=599839 RepID=J4HWF7_9APHY|nr:uncharacterized protein FIBRA_04261 [Fibroporia radiculosa]CCM02182.1 predicted protein [Fibroporia radiculosa]
MNARKRQATDTLLPLRSAKQPRLTRFHPLGEVSTPTHNEGLSARWMRLGVEMYNLARDTLFHWVDGASNSKTLPTTVAGPSQSHSPSPSIPPRPSAPLPPRRTTRQPIPPQFQQFACPSNASQHPSQRKVSLRDPPRSGPSDAAHPAASSSATQRLPPASRARRKSEPSNVKSNLDPHPQPNGVIAHALPPHTTPPRQQPQINPDLLEFQDMLLRKTYVVRDHILKDRHKARVKEIRKKDQEEMENELFEIRRSKGFTSDRESFRTLLNYQAHLENVSQRPLLPSSPSLVDLHSKPPSPPSHWRHSYPEHGFLQRALEKARASLAEPKPPKPYVPALEQLEADKRRWDERINRRIRPPLPAHLPPEDEKVVNALMSRKGVIAKCAREQVTDQDLLRLRPNKWLNDEIINFYGQLIMDRAESLKENTPVNGRKKPLKVHYFNTFFWSKLQGEGYDKARLAKWTKKIDIFQKDVVLIPINHANSHWTAAAINFRKKRIESHDSMGARHEKVFKYLRSYLDAEHRNKKKKPFDFTGWEDYVMEVRGHCCFYFTSIKLVV